MGGGYNFFVAEIGRVVILLRPAFGKFGTPPSEENDSP